MFRPVRLYNTLSRSVELLTPLQPGNIGIYVCGMTVYDYCHIGHARAMMAFDVIVRYLRELGYEVTYVRNHTDVDDKIIQRAGVDGVPALALAAMYIAALEEDLDALGLARPDIEPRVSTHIPDVVDVIARLVERGHAYRADNGDVFFSVESFEGYGRLSGKKLEDLRAGERVALDGNKRHAADFVLWKARERAEGDLAEPSWESPWGWGRPGWHIECSAMARRHLGDRFDIHGGGIDLVFPHHENEIAQSEGATGLHPFATYWLHNGHLTLVNDQGEPVKMSKSIGNVIQIRDLVAQGPCEAVRLAYLDTHYRSPLPWAPDRYNIALSSLDRLYQAKETVAEVLELGVGAPPGDLGPVAEEAFDLASRFPERFHEVMSDDFNTAAAVGLLFELVRAVNRFANDKKKRAKGATVLAPAAEAFGLAGRVLGIGAATPPAFFEEVKRKRIGQTGKTVAEVDALVAARTAARDARDWTRADALRKELDQIGILVMDGATASTWRMRIGE